MLQRGVGRARALLPRLASASAGPEASAAAASGAAAAAGGAAVAAAAAAAAWPASTVAAWGPAGAGLLRHGCALHGSARASAPHATPPALSAAAAQPPTDAGAAPAAAPGSSSGGGGGGKKKATKAAGASGGGSPQQDAADAAAQLAQLKAGYRRSRMLEFYQQILSRELLLKLNVKSVNDLPRLERVDLAIQARDAAGGAYVEKWQLLLHALGLEIVTGQPASFALPASRYYQRRNAVTGVKVSLSGAAAHDALEKIAYLLLPSQNAFDGLLTRQLDRAGNLHFKVSSMVNFPDYEEMFETFENLGSLDVSVVLRGAAKRKGRSQVLLTGLQLPVLARKHQVGGAAAGGGGGGGGGVEEAAGAQA